MFCFANSETKKVNKLSKSCTLQWRNCPKQKILKSAFSYENVLIKTPSKNLCGLHDHNSMVATIGSLASDIETSIEIIWLSDGAPAQNIRY